MNIYINFLLIIYKFIINIYKTLNNEYKENCNINFLYITDFLGSFYVINQEKHLIYENKIIYMSGDNSYDTGGNYIREKSIKNLYKEVVINKLYTDNITRSYYNDIIKPYFIKFNRFYLPIFYHILHIDKYNPYGCYIYLLIINGLKIEKFLLFKPNGNNKKFHRNKILESKYYIKNKMYKSFNNYIMDDANYLKYFQ